MSRFLWISLAITIIALCIAIIFAIHRGSVIKQRDNNIAELQARVSHLEAAVEEQLALLELYAEADKQNAEFEKELNDDTVTENLDVVPDDYILKRLRAD